MAYIEAYHITKKMEYAKVASEIFSYVLRDLKSEEGGFFLLKMLIAKEKRELFICGQKRSFLKFSVKRARLSRKSMDLIKMEIF